jgi:CheY-like chemotaxis protein
VGMTLQHPNLVEILAVNRDPVTKQYFIVMEFVEGGNLRDILVIRKKMEPAEALRMLEDAASALAYAFSRGVTHRDMKLTNVLVSATGMAKLVDFGLAGVYGQMQGAKVNVDRTVDYAGLEKATSVKSGDTRSDIFFLGCVAYEMLTGRSPLSMSRNPRERMSPDRFRRVEPMSREEVNAPPSVFRLVETMMAFYPPDRFQTPQQLLEAIRDARRDLEASKAPPGQTAAAASTGARSIFIVEKDERLQDLLRDKFKEKGYRVLIAGDPARALDRFRKQPFDILVVNGATIDEEGILIFERLMGEAHRNDLPCVGVLMLAEEQKAWIEKIASLPNAGVLIHPVKLKQLQRQLDDLLAMPQKAHEPGGTP